MRTPLIVSPSMFASSMTTCERSTSEKRACVKFTSTNVAFEASAFYSAVPFQVTSSSRAPSNETS